MAPKLGGQPVGLNDHGHGVPAHEGADAPLHGPVPGEALLLLDRDRIEVGGVGAVGQVGPGAPRLVDEPLQQEVGALHPLLLQHGLEGVQPLLCFLGVDIGLLIHEVSRKAVTARGSHGVASIQGTRYPMIKNVS